MPELCSGLGALFGGCGLGAAIEALEQATGRPLVWATAQYLSYARPPSVVEIAITEVVRGHQISQARAVASVDGDEIFTVNAALGTPRLPDARLVGDPSRGPATRTTARRARCSDRHQGTIMDRLDMRLAAARGFDELPGDPGRRPGLAVGAAPVARDVGGGPRDRRRLRAVRHRAGLGQRAGGNSLDNTLRVVQRHPTDWILADMRVHAVADGFGHGLVHLWAEDGTLLGTASQSTIVRFHREHGEGEGAAMSVPQRWGITVPFDGVPLHAHREWFEEIEDLGYTDLWSAEAGGGDAFTPLALAAAWTPSLRLGTAIVPAYTRGAATLAQTVASMVEAAPGRFAVGIGTSSNVIVEHWNGIPFDEPYQRVRDTIRFLRAALAGEKVSHELRHVQREGLPARTAGRGDAADPRRPRCGPGCCASPGARATARSSTGSRPTT